MFNPETILRLYSHVISKDIIQHGLSDGDLQEHLQTMVGVNSPELNISKVTNFNDVLYRCAYLHMYAPMYTEIVKSTMVRILSKESFQTVAPAYSKIFKMCSLGGGPGTDVIGVFLAFDHILKCTVQFQSIITIIDCMGHWKSTFQLLLNEFRKKDYGTLSLQLADNVFHWDYVESDLLGPMSSKVSDAISSSSFISMNKFLSVLRLEDAEIMVKKIFTIMGPGTFLLFIDEASDQLTAMMSRIARENKFSFKHGPLESEYSFQELRSTKFGHTSCHQGNFVAMLLRKPLVVNVIESVLHPVIQNSKESARILNTVNLCSNCERGINKTLDNIIKNSVVDARCISCEDEFKTPASSKSSSPISWKSFGTVAEDDSEDERTGVKNKNCIRWNASTDSGVDKRQSAESAVDNGQHSVVIDISLSETCDEFKRRRGTQCVVS